MSERDNTTKDGYVELSKAIDKFCERQPQMDRGLLNALWRVQDMIFDAIFGEESKS